MEKAKSSPDNAGLSELVAGLEEAFELFDELFDESFEDEHAVKLAPSNAVESSNATFFFI
ncbi:hypothetical protein MU1_15010 [Paenibacillus glycanilyticus]|uniref:Phosphagen kinase N-terminal domain-containing protein n=1 Tax=Paenibacillus glycanilyticus TaxID=126569 RepID=A0ABQ6G873_9BACL|nr:hypothetical protein MU1_15010 [Paenibacillus glycanilyticus]